MHSADEIANVGGLCIPATLYRDNSPRNRTRIVLEINDPIYALICTRLATLTRLAINKRQSPLLELSMARVRLIETRSSV